MKVIFNVPDTTKAINLCVMYEGEGLFFRVASKLIDSNDLRKAQKFTVPKEDEDDCD